MDLQYFRVMEFIELTIDDSAVIVPLAHKLRPAADPAQLKEYLAEMFGFPTFYCFGLRQEGKLIAVSFGWITVRFYSGKQLEVDNVIVDPDLRSQGVGKRFFSFIEQWAVQQGSISRKFHRNGRNAKKIC